MSSHFSLHLELEEILLQVTQVDMGVNFYTEASGVP
jgi:hypothetical protein